MSQSLKQRILSNPLLIREMHRSPNPTLRFALLQSFIASAAFGYFIGIWTNPYSEIIRLIVILLLAAIALIPPYLSYTAAFIVVNDMRSEHVDLLHLTNLSNAQFVIGYIASTYYRCRLLLWLAIAFAPLVLIRAVVVSTHETYFRCMVSAVFSHCTSFPSPLMVFSFIAIFMVLGGKFLRSGFTVCRTWGSLRGILAESNNSDIHGTDTATHTTGDFRQRFHQCQPA